MRFVQWKQKAIVSGSVQVRFALNKKKSIVFRVLCSLCSWLAETPNGYRLAHVFTHHGRSHARICLTLTFCLFIFQVVAKIKTKVEKCFICRICQHFFAYAFEIFVTISKLCFNNRKFLLPSL